MTDTRQLIEQLVTAGESVKRLPAPPIRLIYWFAFVTLILTLIALVHGLRSDLALRLEQPTFVLAMGGSGLTGLTAAYAAFRLSIPGSNRAWLVLPFPAVVAWFSSIGYGCLSNWVHIGPQGIRIGETMQCFATLLLTSAPLAFLMVVMLRYAAFLRPTLVCCVAGLAVAAVTAFAVSLFHDLEATAMILVWNVGVTILLSAIAGVAGSRTLKWTERTLA